MEYIKIRLSADLDKSIAELEKTVDGMFQSMNPLFLRRERAWQPQMDVHETPEEIIITAEIAGVEIEDIEVEANARAIKISGNRRFMFPRENMHYHLAEIQYGPFERTVILPAPIDTDISSASYSNGFLQIRMVKWFGEKNRKIIVESAD